MVPVHSPPGHGLSGVVEGLPWNSGSSLTAVMPPIARSITQTVVRIMSTSMLPHLLSTQPLHAARGRRHSQQPFRIPQVQQRRYRRSSTGWNSAQWATISATKGERKHGSLRAYWRSARDTGISDFICETVRNCNWVDILLSAIAGALAAPKSSN